MATFSHTSGKVWFALQMKSRMEQTIGHLLRTKGYEEFAPTWKTAARSQSVEQPLFPGYVFCRFDPSIRCPIVTTPGVLRVVGFGKTPAVVDEGEIEAIWRIVTSRLHATPHEYLAAGQTVRVRQRPLCGVGKIVSLIVSVKLHQQSVAVEIDHASIEPVHDCTFEQNAAGEASAECSA